jgi:hypothetical protein
LVAVADAGTVVGLDVGSGVAEEAGGTKIIIPCVSSSDSRQFALLRLAAVMPRL